jgi:hypothetical protein
MNKKLSIRCSFGAHIATQTIDGSIVCDSAKCKKLAKQKTTPAAKLATIKSMLIYINGLLNFPDLDQSEKWICRKVKK